MNSYLKLFLGIFITYPLVLAFFSLDNSKESAIYITSLLYFSLYLLGICMYNYLQNGNIFKFDISPKWELHESNKVLYETIANPFLGSITNKVYVDIYRKKMRNGMFKYKVRKIY